MHRLYNSLPAVLAILFLSFTVKPFYRQIENDGGTTAAAAGAVSAPVLHEKRQLPSDLEVGGDLAGLQGEATRYITREELLALPRVTFTVTDDTNFTGATKIGGVSLEELAKRLGAAPESDLVVAICDDKYRSSYPLEYMAAHHPVLVLNVNGQPPSGWPKDSVEHKFDMGPYMISNPNFKPSFKILSHQDEAQIPWGVVRIEFRNEKIVFGSIAPRGSHAAESDVQAGFHIAQQNCLRCHNMGSEGGKKSGVPWTELGRYAEDSPEIFAAYIHDPRENNPNAQMPGNPGYDAPTLAALTSYFKTFAGTENIPREKPREKQ